MAFVSKRSGQELRNSTVAVWLIVLFVLALTLRFAFAVAPAFDAETGRYLYSGNDPYYHDRTVRHIVEEGESLTFDPAINYPAGRANPNPPIFDWTAAPIAVVLDGLGAEDPIGSALNYSTAFWGALTILPVFLIGSQLFGRRAGLWAAFLMGVSAPHIQRTVFGFADHDATTMFFIVLAMAFLVKSLRTLKPGEYVTTWKDTEHIKTGMRRAFTENRVAMLWAGLAATALASIALTWKGYPYVLAIMAVAFGFQLLLDHARNRDSTPLFFVYLIGFLGVILLPLWYYSVAGLTGSTVQPSLYVLYGVLAAGVILVPTRELPSIIVFPALVAAAAIGLVLMLWVFPSVGNQIFSGLGYFEQDKLYTTIAEAQRTELGFVAASFGFFSFLLAFWGFGRAVRHGYKGDAAMLLLASWAAVALFMAFAASRFVMNAAPVFAILAAGPIVTLSSWVRADEVKRRFRSLHGQTNVAMQGVQSLTWRTTVGIFLIIAFLIVPNLWLGVDAATPSEFDAKYRDGENDKLGAFGLSFDIKRNGWLPAFNHLATLDQDEPLAERPAFVAWWDYGHWATDLGRHPTVADPFQSNFVTAGRVLASESEAEAFQWLSILMIRVDARDGLSSSVQQILQGVDPELGDPGDFTDHELQARLAEELDAQETHRFFIDISDAVDRQIGYMGVDSRMYPTSASNTGILYAPIFLADKNPDDFTQVIYQGQGGMNLALELYDMDENNLSYRLDPPRTVDQSGNEWVVFGGQAYPAGRSPLELGDAASGVAVTPNLDVKEPFTESMYRRAFGHITTDEVRENFAPGDGLVHWRAIHQSKGEVLNSEEVADGAEPVHLRQVVLLQYYAGYEISGAVRNADGEAIPGVRVTVFDGFGAHHDAVQTDEEGGYTILAPFGEDLQLVVDGGSDTQAIHSQALQVTREQAAGQVRQDPLDITIPFAEVQGFAYEDLDGDGIFGAEDQALAGANITIGGRVTATDSDGHYLFSDLDAGTHTVTASLAGYEDHQSTLSVAGGESTDHDVVLAPAQSEVTITFTDNGEPVAGVPIRFEGPDEGRVTTDENGTAMRSLSPGTYVFTIDHTTTEDGVEISYDEERTVEIPFGGEPFAFTIETSDE